MTACTGANAAVGVVLSQARATTGGHKVVSGVFFPAMAACASNAGVIVCSVGGGDKRIAIIPAGVAKVTIGVHVVRGTVHLVLAIAWEQAAFAGRRGTREGAVTILATAVVPIKSRSLRGPAQHR